MNKVLFIIPAHNEEKNIASVVEELKRDASFADILVVNDCSTDNTLSVIENLDINYLSLPFNLGYSGALQSGFKFAVKNKYDYVIQFDGDGQHIASEAGRLFKTLKEKDVDIVIGSRFKAKSEYKHSFFRRLGTNMFRFIIKHSCKTEVYDPTSGFQVLNRKTFVRYATMNRYPDFPDANLIIEMLLEGFKIEEVQVNMRERLFGESMHSGIIKPVKYMIRMFYSIFLILLRGRSVLINQRR